MERLELAGITVEAISVGGIETCIHLPHHRLAFDIGRCPEEVVKRDTVLFTHGHMDHMGGVAFHCATRALRNMSPPTYVVPRGYEEALERLFEAWRGIDHSTLPHRLVPLDPGEEFELSDTVVVRPFEVSHTAKAQGYAILSRRKKLRAEYRGLDGQEIRRLRIDEGVEVTEPIESVEVAFCGDTRIDVVERVEDVRRARLLIMETTFVDDRVSARQSREKGHIHLEDVVRVADRLENEAILLHHFSARYAAREILAAVDAALPAGLRERVTCLVGGHFAKGGIAGASSRA